MKSSLFVLIVLALFLCPTFLAYALDNSSSLAFPSVTFTVTAEVSVDTSVARSLYATLAFQQLHFAPIGEEGIHCIRFTKFGAIVSLTTKLWIIRSGDVLVPDISISPSISKEGNVGTWSLENFLAEGNSLVEHTSLSTGSFNVTTAFNSLTYQYLFLSGVRTYSSGSNSTIVVSYSDQLAGNISDASDTTNATIYNAFLPTEQNLFFRLDLEASSRNSSRPYVLHIAFTNFRCNAYYITSLAQDFRDARYLNIKIADSPVVTTGSEDWQTVLSHPEDQEQSYVDNTVKAVGWTDADELEADLKESWSTALKVDESNIVDYNITDAYVNGILDHNTSEQLYSSYQDAKDKTSDINTQIASTKKSTIRTFTVTTKLRPRTLQESSDSDDIQELSTTALAAAIRSRGKATSFSSRILDKIISSMGHISKTFSVWLSKARTSINALGVGDNWILIGALAGAFGIGVLLTIVARKISKR